MAHLLPAAPCPHSFAPKRSRGIVNTGRLSAVQHRPTSGGSHQLPSQHPRPNRLVQLRACLQSSPTVTPLAQELTWKWKWGSHIRYFKAGAGPPLVLVHGFGVGAWHFERNLEHLAGCGYTVYAIDLLGQGSSWPCLAHPSDLSSAAYQDEDGPLRLSITTWTDQLAGFLREVVGAPAYMAGNSLGGYVAVSLAATQPEQVKGLVLINSTPFWSFRPSGDQPQGLWSWLGFDGSVPAPQNIRSIVERFWWNNLRSRETIESMLAMVYAHKPAVSMDPTVAERIIEATEHPSALDAFVSIVASPKSPQPFDALLCAARCPICLVYGKQDPWVVPAWGQRAQHVLTEHGCPPAMYLELDGAGHCPHHEAPMTTNTAMQMSLNYMEQLAGAHGAGPAGERLPAPIPVGYKVPVAEADGRVVVIEHVDGRPRTVGERLSHAVWNFLDSLREPVGNHQEVPGKAQRHA